jgi:hypothetical protein
MTFHRGRELVNDRLYEATLLPGELLLKRQKERRLKRTLVNALLTVPADVMLKRMVACRKS